MYNFSLKDVPLRKMFLYTSLLGALLGMTQILLITGKPTIRLLQGHSDANDTSHSAAPISKSDAWAGCQSVALGQF